MGRGGVDLRGWGAFEGEVCGQRVLGRMSVGA